MDGLVLGMNFDLQRPCGHPPCRENGKLQIFCMVQTHKREYAADASRMIIREQNMFMLTVLIIGSIMCHSSGMNEKGKK